MKTWEEVEAARYPCPEGVDSWIRGGELRMLTRRHTARIDAGAYRGIGYAPGLRPCTRLAHSRFSLAPAHWFPPAG
ncbi:hypothetical protein NITHO_2690008 [Nitrolancea hollandica Lb]|uniref:Uncharacterized protein n=1 Tax=Nitrolancea hollandica Lb TaxID=1129897 RepID=I4EGC7_9BACT|nr:hypothetical protein NITHO_2690008 [Nitrolancea hollandica Lb]